MAKRSFKNSQSKEIGFGQKAYSRETRLITQEGQYNVQKTGMRFWETLDIYHELVSMKWATFILFLLSLFILVNLIFATLYYFAGQGSISGTGDLNTWEHFLSSFYFSTQTITTLGYGSLSPKSDYVSLLAAIESFLGLLGFALATGLMFARFSRPRRNLAYSHKAIIAPFHDINALMFRFINKGKNQLVEAEVDMVITYWSNKEKRRIFRSVDLEYKKINFFSTSWTVVHPISEKSPIYGWTAKDFEKRQVEVIIWFKAFDDTYVRQVYDRSSYVFKEIEWGKKYVPIYEHTGSGQIQIDVEKLGETIEAPLN